MSGPRLPVFKPPNGNGLLLPKLTPREIEILELLALGLSCKMVAEKLFLSEQTVKNHSKDARDRLEVGNTVEAVRKAMLLGIIPTPTQIVYKNIEVVKEPSYVICPSCHREYRHAHKFTPRERKIVKMMTAGLIPRQMAAKFGTSEQTVKNQVHNVYRKLNASTRWEALKELGVL